MGDEAVALGAVHAGLTAAYAYPGTPSTEAFEFLLRYADRHGHPVASWCANEKTAYEQALGVSMVSRRSLVVMKHVGLNVAADPFINSAIVSVHGGLVLAIADDPGMHSSQNEQDSRFYADFARIVCFEPANQQEAYEMTREAFEVSERFEIPVMVRLVTRLAHSRSIVEAHQGEAERPLDKARDPASWTLLPAHARGLWRRLLDTQSEMLSLSEESPFNPLELSDDDRGLGIITTGIARGYLRQNLSDLDYTPSLLHLGVYPIPVSKVRVLAEKCDRILVLEEGYPLVERQLRGLLPTLLPISGKETGELPLDGELTPESVRRSLGLPTRAQVQIAADLPARPPQLCPGCPHRDSYDALREALGGYELSIVNADIGCYTLGAAPPYQAIESCVCMGAAVGMAKGAADAGLFPVVAVIGDSTFLHSGVTPLMDAVAADTDMTLMILDNEAVGMTGAQHTVLASSRLEPLVLGLGVDPDHCHVVEARPNKVNELTAVLRRELEHRGLSVVIPVRECIEHVRRRKAEAKRS
ncbi:MAG: indolepyruvate ferredoxin oxidoreductase [bacterium]|nr:indolepyruvate ferredoxin oxidoreductase [bacterium]